MSFPQATDDFHAVGMLRTFAPLACPGGDQVPAKRFRP
jgi:hypothetical protein